MAAGLIARRLLQAAAALLVVLLVVFVCLLTTGDPVEMLAPPEATARDKAMIRQAYGLDRPPVQFGVFVWRAARRLRPLVLLDRPALGLVSERLPASPSWHPPDGHRCRARRPARHAAVRRATVIDQLVIGVALLANRSRASGPR